MTPEREAELRKTFRPQVGEIWSQRNGQIVKVVYRVKSGRLVVVDDAREVVSLREENGMLQYDGCRTGLDLMPREPEPKTVPWGRKEWDEYANQGKRVKSKYSGESTYAIGRISDAVIIIGGTAYECGEISNHYTQLDGTPFVKEVE